MVIGALIYYKLPGLETYDALVVSGILLNMENFSLKKTSVLQTHTKRTSRHTNITHHFIYELCIRPKSLSML